MDMRGDWIRRRATDERLAGHAGFWWGLAEGTFFFIVPDVYISFATLFSLRTGAVGWLLSILGSLVAVLFIYLISVVGGFDYLAFLPFVPGVTSSMLERVGDTVDAQGLPFTVLLVLGGVPLKVYGGVAFSLGLSLGSVLVWTVFARIVRIAPTYVFVAGLRWLFGRRIDAHPKIWLIGVVLVWVGFYVFYFIEMS